MVAFKHSNGNTPVNLKDTEDHITNHSYGCYGVIGPFPGYYFFPAYHNNVLLATNSVNFLFIHVC